MTDKYQKTQKQKLKHPKKQNERIFFRPTVLLDHAASRHVKGNLSTRVRQTFTFRCSKENLVPLLVNKEVP